MNLFDIVGPVMVGPSSSHTAGAVRIGQVSRHLLGESVKEAKILLHGSFLATGKGHGTDKALVAGLLGMAADDIRIPDSFDIAKESGVKFEIGKIQLKNAHPNSVKLLLVGESGSESGNKISDENNSGDEFEIGRASCRERVYVLV